MHFKWDSSVARDISNELDRLEDNLGECMAEVDHCATILREMAGSDPEGLIEKYVSLTEELKKKMRRLGERFRKTSRGINNASELFEGNEQELLRRAESMGEGPASGVSDAGDPAWGGTAPLFFNIPGMGTVAPIGVDEAPRYPVWAPLEFVNQAVVIDQVAPEGGVVTPPWLLSIIDTDYEQGRYH